MHTEFQELPILSVHTYEWSPRGDSQSTYNVIPLYFCIHTKLMSPSGTPEIRERLSLEIRITKINKYLKRRKECEKKRSVIKESEFGPNSHSLVPHFSRFPSNSHS